MSRKYKFGPAYGLYFVSYTAIGWVDLFTRDSYCRILTDSLCYCIAHKGMLLYAWCIMPSHVHLIFSADGSSRPEAILRDHKRHTSEAMRAAIASHPGESRREWLVKLFSEAGTANGNNRGWQFWQQDNHPIEVFSPAVIQQKLNYLHRNPLKAGYVDRPEAGAGAARGITAVHRD